MYGHIYLHVVDFDGFHVGKYTIPMDPMVYSPAAATPAELGSVWRKIFMTQWASCQKLGNNEGRKDTCETSIKILKSSVYCVYIRIIFCYPQANEGASLTVATAGGEGLVGYPQA